MPDLLSKLMSSLSSSGCSSDRAATSATPATPAAPAAHTLLLRPSPVDPKHTVVYPAGYPVVTPPLYTITTSKEAKPNISIFRGWPALNTKIGEGNFSSMSSTTHLFIMSHSISMKQSQMSGDFSIESTPMGKLKWGANKMTGTGLELRDSVGNKVAQIKSGGKEGKRLEILVPWSEQLVDLVVLSGMAAKAMNKKTMEAMSEVIQAVAGG